MTEETIQEKLEKLSKMRRLLKEKKIRRIKDKKLKYGRFDFGDEDDEYDYEEDLLSHPELLEEALKEYMYQFGMSIYQNRQGDYYFKQFENNMDTRAFEELDKHHFALRTREPSFLEKILEKVPEEKIHMTDSMESTVLDLYEKDATMADILDQMVENEIVKCQEAVIEMDTNAKQQQSVSNDLSVSKEMQTEIFENGSALARDEDIIENSPAETSASCSDTDCGDDTTAPVSEGLEAYQCGEDRVEKVSLSKPLKVRRVKQAAKAPIVTSVKDNSNNR